MNAYKFLFKPVFFIFSLLFASWVVLKIEKLSPSDFGKYKTLFEKEETPKLHKQHLKKLIYEYKTGKIDSILLEEKLEKLFEEKDAGF